MPLYSLKSKPNSTPSVLSASTSSSLPSSFETRLRVSTYSWRPNAPIIRDPNLLGGIWAHRGDFVDGRLLEWQSRRPKKRACPVEESSDEDVGEDEDEEDRGESDESEDHEDDDATAVESVCTIIPAINNVAVSTVQAISTEPQKPRPYQWQSIGTEANQVEAARLINYDKSSIVNRELLTASCPAFCPTGVNSLTAPIFPHRSVPMTVTSTSSARSHNVSSRPTPCEAIGETREQSATSALARVEALLAKHGASLRNRESKAEQFLRDELLRRAEELDRRTAEVEREMEAFQRRAAEVGLERRSAEGSELFRVDEDVRTGLEERIRSWNLRTTEHFGSPSVLCPPSPVKTPMFRSPVASSIAPSASASNILAPTFPSSPSSQASTVRRNPSTAHVASKSAPSSTPIKSPTYSSTS